MSRLGRHFLHDHDIFVIAAYLAVILAIPQRAFGWGREGHQMVVIVAEHYMRPETATHTREPLAPRPNAVRPYTGPQPRAPSPQALKFVIHFVGDLHQPLHDEDNGDKGGNMRHVIFRGHPDNLHWVWDTGLLQHINRNPAAFAAELESRITPQNQAEWQKGSIEDWVMEGHRLAHTKVRSYWYR
jgi:hypothetical protein